MFSFAQYAIQLIQVGMEVPQAQADDMTTDNAIVLSFRKLQLKRIGDLQDKLIELSLVRAPPGQALRGDHFDEEQSNRVNEELRAYGG